MTDTSSGALSKREMLQELIMEKHRTFFPTLAHTAYFNYGAQGLLSRNGRDAINGYYDKMAKDGPFTMNHTMDFLNIFKAARTHFAVELGVETGSIALVENTSMGCNMALWGLDWQRGDHLLMTDQEYPGVIASVEELARRFDLQIDTWALDDDPQVMLQNLEAALCDKTRLVVLSHIPWTTGRILPLADICRRVHAFGAGRTRVMVDAAQSVGVLPLDLKTTEVDFYAFTAHKWLCAPEGTGGLYVRPEALAGVRTTFAGPRSIDLDHRGEHIQLWPSARRFEVSTQGTALYAALNATMDLHRKAGSSKDRFARLNKLARRLHGGLRSLQERGYPLKCLQEAPPEAGLVFFQVEQNRKLVLHLEAEHMNVRTIPTTDCVRASIHYLTLVKEVDRLLEGIKMYCEKGKAGT